MGPRDERLRAALQTSVEMTSSKSHEFSVRRQSMKLLTPREAAQVLGISYPTLKQWIYKEKIRTVKTAGGHHRVPEK
ncbi:MAG: excisionase family DNA-binding protein, partial [Candidatus Acidiferrales bacterium]